MTNVVGGKTSVIYSDENSYLRGKILPGSKRAKDIQQIWQSQYQPMRTRGANVYFFPGNHEWNKTPRKKWKNLNGWSNTLPCNLTPW